MLDVLNNLKTISWGLYTSLVNFFEEGGGDVGGDDQGGDATEGDGHTILSGYTDHTAPDTGKGAIGNEDFLVGEETTTLRGNCHDMGILERGGSDEGLHLDGGDGQGRVAIVKTYGEVVIVIGDERTEWVGMDKGIGLVGGDIGEDHVKEGLEHPFLLAIADLLLPAQSEVGIDALVYEIVGCQLLTVVGDTEDVPALVWVWGVRY